MCVDHSTATTGQNHDTPATDTNHWRDVVEDIPVPGVNASEKEWLDYAEDVAKAAGLPPGLVTAMIQSKGNANFAGSIDANDGTGEQLHGPLLVHGGLLSGGQFSDSGHALLNGDGEPLTADELRSPATAILAGVQHLKQLIAAYNGDLGMALNHYQTGDAANGNHALANWCEPGGDHAGGGAHGQGRGHGGSAHGSGTGGGHSGDHGDDFFPGHSSGKGATHGAGHGGGSGHVGEGDIAPESHGASGHIGAGHGLGGLINTGLHDSAMDTIFGMSGSQTIDYIISTMDSVGGYNAGQSPEQKEKGAYLVANMLMKQAMLPPELFGSEQEAGSVYAQAKLFAIEGDTAGLRLLIESQGGNTAGLSDEELINIWATNEHNNLHGIIMGNMTIANAVHMTSLNDNAADGTTQGTLGGYNDKGEYPQWGWFEDLGAVSGLFPQLQVTA